MSSTARSSRRRPGSRRGSRGCSGRAGYEQLARVRPGRGASARRSRPRPGPGAGGHCDGAQAVEVRGLEGRPWQVQLDRAAGLCRARLKGLVGAGVAAAAKRPTIDGQPGCNGAHQLAYRRRRATRADPRVRTRAALATRRLLAGRGGPLEAAGGVWVMHRPDRARRPARGSPRSVGPEGAQRPCSSDRRRGRVMAGASPTHRSTRSGPRSDGAGAP